MSGGLKDAFARLIYGNEGGLTYSDIDSYTKRTKFSKFLIPAFFRENAIGNDGVFINVDGSIGVGWECSPLVFAGKNTNDVLMGIFRASIPDGSVLQFILHADSYVDPILDEFVKHKTARGNALSAALGKNLAEYFKASTAGFERLGGIPARNFRLFVFLKMPDNQKTNLTVSKLKEITNSIQECLAGARLHPRPVNGNDLVDWMRRIMNDVPDKNIGDAPTENNRAYDPKIPIHKQIIFNDTKIVAEAKSIKIGSKQIRCVTPKSIPAEIDSIQTNQLFGGIWGLTSDNDQIKLPFIYSLNIIFENMKGALHSKCNLVLQQKGVGSFATTLAKKQNEYLWATDKLESGMQFVRVMPSMLVYGRDENLVAESASRIKRIWESSGYVMQEDTSILPIMFLSSLPFGLINRGSNIDNIDRDFIAPASAVLPLLPVQGDFAGGGKPALMFVGRKGQLASIDIYDPRAKNHNILITAASGAGKSFYVNLMTSCYYGANAKIRIIDIGGSYKKTTTMFDAKYLDFSPDSDVCLNPYSNIRDLDLDIPMVGAILAAMCFSSGNEEPGPIEQTILERVAKLVYEQSQRDGSIANIDSTYKVLNNPKNYMIEEKNGKEIGLFTEETAPVSRKLAFLIQKFTTAGPYGRYFNKESSLDITKDDFVVLELEHLAQNKPLFNVITLLVVNLVTSNLYLSDRSTPIFIMFDEAHQFLREFGPIALAIETGYRRARKYGGSFSIITQSVLDLKKFGTVGEVIWANSDFKFLLESTDFNKAVAEKVITYDDFMLRIMNTVKSFPPKYSEVFIDSSLGTGVVRLIVDRFAYYAFTSKGSEIAAIEKLVSEGMSYENAIYHMVNNSRE